MKKAGEKAGGKKKAGRAAAGESAAVCRCVQCGYEWVAKVPGRKPKSCPKCKRYDYEEEKESVTA